MRTNIAFKATDGTTLRGWHYLPDGAGKHPTIVMAHGFSAVKEMYLGKYAEAFAQAGFASLVYDKRNFGASDGEPRQEIDPWLQIRDYSDAITFARNLEQTDADRIGIWGSSYSGGHVLAVAAIDRRVKCVVSQVPVISGWQNFRRLVRADFLAPLRAGLHADRDSRAAGRPPAMLPFVAEDPMSPSASPPLIPIIGLPQRPPPARQPGVMRLRCARLSTGSAMSREHISVSSPRHRF